MMATSEFGKAFAAARKAGDKTFEFNGKKYTTKTAEDVAKEKKESSNAKQRDRSDMIVALTKAEKDAPKETTPLAKQKIAEAKRKVTEEYATAGKDEDMKAYKPRPTPGARAPKQTVSKPAAKKPYMPEQPEMNYAKGGKINGIAKRGLTKCKMV
jgi:hypothetical protein